MSQSDADDFRYKSFTIQTSKEARKDQSPEKGCQDVYFHQELFFDCITDAEEEEKCSSDTDVYSPLILQSILKMERKMH